MRAWISFVVALCVLAPAPIGLQMARATEPASDCGTPANIDDGWNIGSPEHQGFEPALLCAMGKGIADGKLANVDSIVVVRHGALVYERYFDEPNHGHFDPTVKHAGHSMIKSVVSLLVGIALDRGQIKDLDAPVLSYFPEYSDLRSPEKDHISLRHLLTMSDGLEWDEADFRFFPNSYRTHFVLEQKVVAPPGERWNYNTGESALIAAVLGKVTGRELHELARAQLFEPLGIDDVKWVGPAGLWLRPRDWAKIGQLVLDHGAWQGKQIVSASWVAQSTTPLIKAREPFSYGFQWWLGHSSINNRTIAWTAAMGFNSQKTIIVPELDMVVVFNASRQSIAMVAPELELLDHYILPAISTN